VEIMANISIREKMPYLIKEEKKKRKEEKEEISCRSATSSRQIA